MPKSKARESKSDYEKELDAFLRNLAKVYPLDKAEARVLREYGRTRGNISKAAAVGQISRKTFYNWLEREHFLEAVAEVDEFMLDQAVEVYQTAAHFDWKAARSLLERLRPDQFNSRLIEAKGLQTTPPSDEIPTQVTLVRGEDPELQRRKKRGDER